MDHDQEMDDSPSMDEIPNIEGQKFYELLDATQKPLSLACNNHTKLSFAVRFLTNKSEENMSQRSCDQRSCDQTLALMKETHPTGNLIPKDFYRAKKLVSKLGLTTKRIDCCVDGCMLFYSNEEIQLKECKFCHKSCFQIQDVGRGKYKEVFIKRMHYYLSFLGLRDYMTAWVMLHIWGGITKIDENLECYVIYKDAFGVITLAWFGFMIY